MAFNLGKFLSIVRLLAPPVLASIPGGEKIAPLVPAIAGAIEEAEAIHGASGAEKKQHVLAVTAAAVEVVNATGKVKLDPASVQAVTSQGIDAVIGAVNVVKQAHASPSME